MTNLVTKVTVRQRPIQNGQKSLYLDFYPAIRNPKTGRLSRREFLGIYIYANPQEKFQCEYNRSMLLKAELIRCRRIESIVNEEFGFLDRSRGNESFLDYFNANIPNNNNQKDWKLALNHFKDYCGGTCSFKQLSADFCQGFLDYLLQHVTPFKKTMMASSANNVFSRLKTMLNKAHEDGKIKENIAAKLQMAKKADTHREFLTLDEVKKLAVTPCVKPVLKDAGLFACLTGLRISDIIRLKWEDIQPGQDKGWCMRIITQKTKTDAVLPLSDEALGICGERGEGQVFKGLSESIVSKYLKDWIKAAGITKHITFHCFRHTYATLQLAAGTDLYTISKMLTHSNIATTQMYVEVVSDLKREASGKISLKDYTDDKQTTSDCNVAENDTNDITNNTK